MTKISYMVSGDLYRVEKEIQSRIRLLGFLNIKYLDNRDGTPEERENRRIAHQKELDRLKAKRLMLCKEHAKLFNAEGSFLTPGDSWWGVRYSELMECGYNLPRGEA